MGQWFIAWLPSLLVLPAGESIDGVIRTRTTASERHTFFSNQPLYILGSIILALFPTHTHRAPIVSMPQT